MKKMLSLLIAIVFVILGFFQADAADYIDVKNSLTKMKSSETYDLDPKVFSTAKLDDDFEDDSVIVVLNKEASKNDKDYYPDDFKVSNCKEVEDIAKLNNEEKTYAESIWNLNSSSESSFHLKSEDDFKSPVKNKTLVNAESFRRILLLELEVKGKDNVLETIEQLKDNEDIYYVGPNYIYNICSTIPNDPHYTSGQQWGINKIELPNA